MLQIGLFDTEFDIQTTTKNVFRPLEYFQSTSVTNLHGFNQVKYSRNEFSSLTYLNWVVIGLAKNSKKVYFLGWNLSHI